ncbi:hypothetical protein EV424DRAFT_1353849, partial [Suillus variegatus]
IPSSEFRTSDTRDPAVSGFGCPELGTRHTNPPNPNPQTRDCRVSGFGCPELGTWDNLGRSIQYIPSSEFRTPKTQNPKPETAGSRVSDVRNSELVPSSGHPKPETRQSRVSGFGVRGSGVGTSRFGVWH